MATSGYLLQRASPPPPLPPAPLIQSRPGSAEFYVDWLRYYLVEYAGPNSTTQPLSNYTAWAMSESNDRLRIVLDIFGNRWAMP